MFVSINLVYKKFWNNINNKVSMLCTCWVFYKLQTFSLSLVAFSISIVCFSLSSLIFSWSVCSWPISVWCSPSSKARSISNYDRQKNSFNTWSVKEWNIAEFANSVDPDEAAHNELPHLDLHCFPTSLWILNTIQLNNVSFFNFADLNFLSLRFWCFIVLHLRQSPILGTLPCISATFTKGNNFCDFLFVFPSKRESTPTGERIWSNFPIGLIYYLFFFLLLYFFFLFVVVCKQSAILMLLFSM